MGAFGVGRRWELWVWVCVVGFGLWARVGLVGGRFGAELRVVWVWGVCAAGGIGCFSVCILVGSCVGGLRVVVWWFYVGFGLLSTFVLCRVGVI